MGFVKAQREQIQVPVTADGAFIPAAAKSNALIAGTVGGVGEGVGDDSTAAADDDDDVLIGLSHVSHFNAELGFDKAQREQIHVPTLLEGAFIPAAAKSNALTAGTGGVIFFITVASRNGGVVVLFTPKMPDNCGLPLLSTTLSELAPGPKVDGFAFGLTESNPKEKGGDDLEAPDGGSNFGINDMEGVGELLTPKMSDNCGLLLLPITLGGLPPKPKADGFAFGLAGSNPKEKGVDVDEFKAPDDRSSNVGSDETGRLLTRICILATTELGKIEVVLDVMTKAGRELAGIVRAFALMSSTLISLTSTFFVCSCSFGDPDGETSVGLNEKLKLEEGGSNLKSDFGRPGEGTGDRAGLNAGVDGAEVPSGWKLNLNLLGSLGTELNLLRDAVGLTLVGLVAVLEGEDPFSMIGMINFDCCFVFSLCSTATMSISSNMSIVISGSEATIGVLSTAVGVGLRPLIESLVRFADRRASSASSSSTSSTTYVILLVSTTGASHCARGLSWKPSVMEASIGFSKCAGGRDRWLPYRQFEYDCRRYLAYRYAPLAQ
jgi:hypothetical protein